MSGGEPAASRDLAKIYVAQSVFEAELVRRTLSRHGIECLIPGDDLSGETGRGLEENAIFVLSERRDEALGLLEQAWKFFEGMGDEG